MGRQFLLGRTDRTPLEVIGRLVALQAQEPNWAYVGLWSRIHSFTQPELTALLEDRQVVRSGLLRSTQHLAAADDFRRLRPLLQPARPARPTSPGTARAWTRRPWWSRPSRPSGRRSSTTSATSRPGACSAKSAPTRSGRLPWSGLCVLTNREVSRGPTISTEVTRPRPAPASRTPRTPDP
ncbi:DNA glycosylase AlkZ-like family protein [Streptomyces sp. NPDC015032]|uniref:DNA glycosylase AlkZ-like family protein n=1 Tax=Streptomyces sp. NPDC015032 TaxID=3364937 RepID=UPI0036FC95A8